MYTQSNLAIEEALSEIRKRGDAKRVVAKSSILVYEIFFFFCSGQKIKFVIIRFVGLIYLGGK